MSRSGIHSSVICTLLLFVATIVRGQTTTFSTLPPAPTYSDGEFTSPDTSRNQVIDKGVIWNVTWETSFNSVNLYLIFGDGWNSPKALTIGTTDTYYIWTVDDSGNNTLPFTFRIANAQGTEDEQANGGFATGGFWIRDDALASTTSSSTTSSTTSTSSTQTSSTQSSSTSIPSTTSTSTSSTMTASPASTTPINPATSDRSAQGTSYSGPPLSSSGSPALETNTSAPSPTNISSPSGLSTGTLAGIVVGAVALLAIIIGASLYFRRQRRPLLSPKHQDLMEIQMSQDGQWGHSKPTYTVHDPSSFHEKSADGIVELPNYRSSRRHELE